MTRSLLVSLPGQPFDVKTLFPDTRLAAMAASLMDAGHETQVVDLGTVEAFARQFPAEMRSVTRSFADRLFSERTSSPLEYVAALWRLRGMRQAMQTQRKAFLRETAADLLSFGGIDFIVFDVSRAEDFAGVALVAQQLRASLPRLRMACAGLFAQHYAPLLGSARMFDCFLVRDPERTVVAWAECVGDAEAWEKVPNLFLPHTGRMTEYRGSSSVNTLPLPVYDEDVYPAMAPGGKLRLFDIECSRGCGRKCLHCAEPGAEAGSAQMKSARRIGDEMAQLVRQHAGTVFRLTGGAACANYAASVAFEVLSRGLPVRYCRTGAVADMNAVIFSALQASGCQALDFHIGTGSQWMLDGYYNRGFCVTPLEAVLRESRRCGIYTSTHFTYPVPADDYHTRAETVRLIERTRPDAVVVSLPEAMPGSEWYNQAESFGFELDKPAFIKRLMTEDVAAPSPLRLWKSQRYLRQGRTLARAADERDGLIRECAELGVSTVVTAELALAARVSGHGGHEDEFSALLARRFFTGDAASLAAAVDRFNERAAALARPSLLGYPPILAAVGN